MADELTPSGGEALAAAGGLISEEKLKGMAGEKGEKTPAPEAGNPAQEAKKIQPKGGDKAAIEQAKQEAETKPVESAKGGEPVSVKTPFGTKVFGVKENESGETVLSSFEDVQAFAKVNNLEIKEVNDLQNIIKNFSKMSEAVNALGGLQKQVENYERTLKSLPTEVSLILDSAIKGQDYSQLIQNIANRGALDYSKPFSSYMDHDLINHYNDQKHTAEEFKEMDPGQYDALKQLAKTKYEIDQASYNATLQQTQRSTELKQHTFDQSVENSIKQLRTNNPDMGEAEIKRVRDIMIADLPGTLFNDDGYSYRPEAAERIAMQEFGKDAILAQQHTIGELVSKYTNQGASQAREQILQHSDKRPLSGTGLGGADENVISEAVKRATSFVHASG